MMGNESEALRMLYGSHAAEIYAGLESIDPELNALIQEIAYDGFWLRPGLSVREKSIITLSALIAMRFTGPLRLHMIGFQSSGGTRAELQNGLIHLIPYVGFPAVLNAFSVLSELEKEQVLAGSDREVL